MYLCILEIYLTRIKDQSYTIVSIRMYLCILEVDGTRTNKKLSLTFHSTLFPLISLFIHITDFQKPHNNNNKTMNMNMLTKEKQTKKQDNELHQVVFSDDNTDNEEKKQKRVAGGSGKRGGIGGGDGGGSCQAEKCTVDLSEVKRYHRRHKVCEFHAKAPSVLVSGLRQRFCQQCSRFHELSEFDETKRSCRRRLAGHNERRRKSTSELQAEGGSGSSSRTKASPAANPQCRPADHVTGGRVQMTSPGSYPASTPTYKHFQLRQS